MSEERFKLPRSSYDEISKIIKTYGHLQEPASLDEVSKLVGMNRTMISANNAFLTQIEVLEPGQKKMASSKGRDLALALEHEMPNEIRNGWYHVVKECPFLDKIVASIRIRNGMDESTLHSHIAYSAGEAKKGPVMTGARAVVDILRAAEVIEEVDGKFVVKVIDVEFDTEEVDSTIDDSDRVTYKHNVLPSDQITVASNSANVQISVKVNVDCKLSELDDLGPKLIKLIDSLKNSANETTTEDN